MASVRALGELGLIQRIRNAPGAAGSAGVKVSIGDDTAVLEVTPGAVLLATTDLLVEDVHFRRTTCLPRDIGWKALAVNLSDIAAMGGTPRWALVGLALPAAAEVEEVDEFYAGLREAAAPHGVIVVGGDTSASTGGWVVNITLLGEHHGTPRLRSMARPGDAIAVTGTLGGAAAGLAMLQSSAGRARSPLPAEAIEEIVRAHLRPTARVAEGRFLGGDHAVRALMDCSDGLATDLGHICRESGLAARIEVDRLPMSAAVREAARALGRDPIAWATSGGEDYELLLTCDRAEASSLAAGLAAATGTPLTVIGEVAAGAPDITWVGARGELIAVVAGYEHFRG